MVYQKQLVVVLAPAKLNLSLDVAGLLPNGYHDLDMVMQTIDLYERITLRRSADLTLRLPGSFVPPNDKNTAYKAAVAFFNYTGLLAGVDITIQKHVPVRAGMAGGSADAAGVLVGLNELYSAQLSMSELCAIGAGIGADVPFALMGGTCRVKGVGDLIKPLPPCPDCWFVVVMPSVGISTPEAFKRYDIMGSPVHPDCERQEQAIRENDLAAARRCLVCLMMSKRRNRPNRHCRPGMTRFIWPARCAAVRAFCRALPKRTTHPGGKNKPAGCRSAACDLPIAFVSLILCLLWFIKTIGNTA